MARNQADIIATGAIACLACAAVAEGAPHVLTTILGILLFVTPGYLLGQLLLPSKTDTLERVVVMTGFALAVPILGGLLLYAARIPLRLPAWLGLLVGVTVVTDVALFIRRRSGRTGQFTWQPALHLSRLPLRHWVLFISAVLIAACAVGVARVGVANQPQPTFTQLWLSPENGNQHIENLGVTNDEGNGTAYRLVLLSNGHVSKAWNLILSNGETWQLSVPITGKPSLVANLYRLPNLTQPYRYTTNGVSGPAKSAPRKS